MEKEPNISIDVGGGGGKFFARLAKEDPQKTFIVIDPAAKETGETPPNLHFRKADFHSGLAPLAGQVNRAFINFLFGEIKRKEDSPSESVQGSRAKYRALLKDLKKVLKPGAPIHIIDVRDNIYHIQGLLEEEKYQVLQKPKPIEDKNRTRWSEEFAKLAEVAASKPVAPPSPWSSRVTEFRPKVFVSPEETAIFPMEIEAKWNG